MHSSACPDGLTSTEKLRLVLDCVRSKTSSLADLAWSLQIAFLTLLSVKPADMYRQSLVDLQRNISDQTRVPCDGSRLVLEEEDVNDDGSTHAVCNDGMNIWTGLRRQPVASRFADLRRDLDDEDAIPCKNCRRILLEELDSALREMKQLERDEGLTLKDGKEQEWL
jgi:hypothetical protein